ncbi:hypothetical protein PVAP13_6KG358700 [Panicum virgatum]|uniref:superoxide dismutase n=1 Tax=Panicum virgatum TaxID=38727 RepID=A0A8T0RHZ8_PANVG|nr:hypothetical protein PVAP13_6KG358700 [Panicum virgatum]
MPPPALLFLSLPSPPQPLLLVQHRKAPQALILNLPLTSSRKPALPARPVASLAPAVATLQSDWTRKQRIRRQGGLSCRFSKIVSYYGLTTPPYKLEALEPYMSRRTVELHWGKHHRDYVECLNKQLASSPLYGYTLEELIKEAYNNGNPLPEYNNAAQVWNHHFFWESMQPEGGGLPEGGVLQQIEKDFGSFTNFREEFISSALQLLGSGWVWLLLKRNERKLSVVHTRNAISPLAFGDIPIASLDLWEDDRRTYITNFMDHLISWDTVTLRMMRAESFVNLGEPNIPVA